MCGVSSNVGATHLSIALSNFLCSKFYSNTAYLEMNSSHQICALSGKTDGRKPFVRQRITYYPAMTIPLAQQIQSKHYKYFVLDFGTLSAHTLPEFLHCDIRLVIGYMSPWKLEQFQNFIREYSFGNYNRKEDVYIGNTMGDKRVFAQHAKCLGVRVVPMPFLADPFHITSENFAFFENVLGGN